jgi:cold shock protein
MPKGTIKKVIQDRGYGFIRADDGGEFFFHMSGLQGLDFKNLKEGDPVEFDVEKNNRGSRAINIRTSR